MSAVPALSDSGDAPSPESLKQVPGRNVPRCVKWLTFIAVAGVALAEGPGNTALDNTVALLRSPNFKVRAQAALVLGVQKDVNRVIRPLMGALADDTRAVRAAAAMALGRLGELCAVGPLARVALDPDRTVAEIARRSTETLVAAFLATRGRDTGRHYVLDVARLGNDAELKDRVAERLLAHPRIEVGATMAFDESEGPLAVELELRADVTVSDSAGRVRLVLGLPSGRVLSELDTVAVTGPNRESVLDALARGLERQILAFLGR